ncbi:MAG: winged helix DNA-binding domain-containing protein [Angustibacter sp.]
MDLEAVLARRLATQGLTTTTYHDISAVVRDLLAVQAQDAALARWSLAMRTARPTDDSVCAALDSGAVIRTHVLRGTWHYVAAEDLRWLLALTSPKVLRTMSSRNRSLGLDQPAVLRHEIDQILALLTHEPLTRRQLQGRLGRPDLRGERLGQVLEIAELEGLICSGPLARGQHTYAPLDDRIPPTLARDRDQAIRELVARFFTGHGPATVAHLVRWTTLTKREIVEALDDLGDRFATLTLDDTPHWYAAESPGAAPELGALLLPVFDEAYLTYPGSNFPRSAGHPWGERSHSFAEAGGGVVISDLTDVGWWKRTNTGRTTQVTLGLDPRLSAGRRRDVEAQAVALATYTGRSPRIVYA